MLFNANLLYVKDLRFFLLLHFIYLYNLTKSALVAVYKHNLEGSINRQNLKETINLSRLSVSHKISQDSHNSISVFTDREGETNKLVADYNICYIPSVDKSCHFKSRQYLKTNQLGEKLDVRCICKSSFSS